MTPPAKGSPADLAHTKLLEAIDLLVPGDPSLDTPEGLLLDALADACEKYEKAIYPDLLAPTKGWMSRFSRVRRLLGR